MQKQNNFDETETAHFHAVVAASFEREVEPAEPAHA